MTETSAWLIGRNALIAAIIVVVLNPLAIFLGYHISHSLSSPDLRIEYVRPEPQISLIQLNDNVFKSAVANAFLYAMLMRNLPRWCDSWIKTGEINKFCIPDSIQALDVVIRQIDAEKKAQSHNLKILRSWNGKGKLALTPVMFPDFFNLMTYAYKNKERAIGISQSTFQMATVFHNSMSNLRNELDNLKDVEEQRTGNVVFQVGILNAGDSDGVVLPNAQIKFGKLSLPLKQSVDNGFVVVKSHSFVEAKFVINEKSASQEARKSWQALVIKKVQKLFTIKIMTPTKSIEYSEQLPP